MLIEIYAAGKGEAAARGCGKVEEYRSIGIRFTGFARNKVRGPQQSGAAFCPERRSETRRKHRLLNSRGGEGRRRAEGRGGVKAASNGGSPTHARRVVSETRTEHGRLRHAATVRVWKRRGLSRGNGKKAATYRLQKWPTLILAGGEKATLQHEGDYRLFRGCFWPRASATRRATQALMLITAIAGSDRR